jgi:hypothetical protein
MITFFTTGKPFTGTSGMIQRNALKSWMLAVPNAEVILFGDEEGAAESAKELGIRHVPGVERAHSADPQLTANHGPKVLRSFFDPAQNMARHQTMCYINCDIVLTGDFRPAIIQLVKSQKAFLMVGRRWDTDVPEPIDFDRANWDELLRERSQREGRQLGGGWIDYFVFPRGFYARKLPEMVIGRVYWDQWLVWKAKKEGAAVVDASAAVMAIHQNHDYGYHLGGKTGVWTDEFAQRNYRLAGGRWHLCTIDDATHVLSPDGVKPNPTRRMRAVQRFLRTATESVRLTALDWTRPMRRAIGKKWRKTS